MAWLLNIFLGNDFFGYDTQSTGNKSKSKQMELTKLKRFCTAKETISKVQRQPMKWEKIFANYIINERLIS